MLEVRNLTKRYGDFVAVRDISFTAAQGQILGFLGPNGAGKTTTMRILTGFLPATSGTAKVAGFDVFTESAEVRRRIGYLPENPPLYTEMTAEAYLRFVARIKGMARNTIEDAIDRVINTCGLESVRRRLLGQLSKGYRQRAGLAQALIHDPPVLVLDEPTIGLDPIQIREIRALIQQLAGKRTIILSTHILPEVSQICEKVVIVNEGQVVLEQDMASLKASGSTLEDVFLRVIAKAHDSNHAAEATA
jgi:ABC-2 type transport system ATP-binding protein